jgi:hypothetical protein
MSIFAPPEAAYFCSSFRSPAPTAPSSFRAWAANLSVGTAFQEGTPSFATFRDLSLREVERLLFLSASHYRRAFDLMIPSACGWAHVTMYYGTFFAARCLLGMFGYWVINRNRALHVDHAMPGNQRFAVRAELSSYRGPHEQFWDFFYNNTPALVPWVEPKLASVLSPIGGNRTWFIANRNDINYDSYSACSLATSFSTAFRVGKFPSSLPGAINTQYLALEALLTISVGFAKKLRLRTDALNALSAERTRRKQVRKLILDVTAPSLGRRVRRRVVS